MIDRRQLLRGAAVAATSALVPGCAGHASQLEAGAGAGAAPVPAAWLAEATLAELARAQAAGEATARSLVEGYLARIEALDRRGPALGAIIATNPEALAIADRLDGARRAGRSLGPLHGIPVLLKDNIDTGDRMATTAGSLALANTRAARDAPLVARLRAAGAVILGKANLSEWANFRSSRSVSGWSAVGGQCRNPYALDRSPCGSSSGSAAAVAAGLCAVAVGTETDGSIVCPASVCGVVGIKPTVGLVDGAGIVPIAHSQDTAGPMARTVTDAAILLGALTGVDHAAALRGDGLRGARLGVARGFFGYHADVDARIGEAIAALAAAGAEIVDPVELATPRELGDAELEVLLYEFKADLERYLAGRPGVPVGTLADLVAFNQRHAADELALFGQDLFVTASKKGPLGDAGYRDALALCRRVSRDEGIDKVMAAHRLDALIAPTSAPAWIIDTVNGDHVLGGSSTPAAVAGYPAITVPAGQVHGLPVGLSFFGRASSEAVLLRLAFGFEQATHHRRSPSFADGAADGPRGAAPCPRGGA